MIKVDVDLDMSGLEKLERNLERLDGDHEVPVSELFTDDFMRRNTQFQTFQAMIDAGGVETQEEMAQDSFSEFVAKHTRFNGWDEMFQAAGSEWMMRQLEA